MRSTNVDDGDLAGIPQRMTFLHSAPVPSTHSPRRPARPRRTPPGRCTPCGRPARRPPLPAWQQLLRRREGAWAGQHVLRAEDLPPRLQRPPQVVHAARYSCPPLHDLLPVLALPSMYRGPTVTPKLAPALPGIEQRRLAPSPVGFAHSRP
jgi:hypothetical protein